jgi:uncharacterized protein (DUF433 family)
MKFYCSSSVVRGNIDPEGIVVPEAFFTRNFAVPKLDYRNIEKDPARCGGQPVIAGTRIRVATILVCYRHGMSVEEIVQQYSTIHPADVHDALAYAYDHLEEIEADLAADDEATVKANRNRAP